MRISFLLFLIFLVLFLNLSAQVVENQAYIAPDTTITQDKVKLSTRQNKSIYFDFEDVCIARQSDSISNHKAFFDFEMPDTLNTKQISDEKFDLQSHNSLIRSVNYSIIANLKLAYFHQKTISTKNRDGELRPYFIQKVSNYDANRHYFLSHYFRSKYEEALSRLPQINSQIHIERVEVWVTSNWKYENTGLRPCVGFIDLGENELLIKNGAGNIFNEKIIHSNEQKRFPDNSCNNLYNNLICNDLIRNRTHSVKVLEGMDMTSGVDFQVGNLRKLAEGVDYTLQERLGYISLNTPLEFGEALFVSFSYTFKDTSYQVGEFSDEGDPSNLLFLKMLQPSMFWSTYNGQKFPPWDLMMKNIYHINSHLTPQTFSVNVYYNSGFIVGKKPYLLESEIKGIPLLRLTKLDQLTHNVVSEPDGQMDFIEGLTVVSDKGYLIFPVLEPFGSNLTRQFVTNPVDASRFAFQPLYDMNIQDALKKFPFLDKFTLEGIYLPSK